MASSWHVIVTAAIGGLTDVGFAEATDLVLVIGHQGRGVFDTNTGELVARDEDDTWAWLDSRAGTAKGIGPLSGQTIPVAGLMSDRALQTTTPDGWRAFATDTGVAIAGRDGVTFDVQDAEELQVFGFSPDGDVLVVGTSPTLTILRRS